MTEVTGVEKGESHRKGRGGKEGRKEGKRAENKEGEGGRELARETESNM